MNLHLLTGHYLLLSSVAEQAPKDSTLCVFHTHVANQLSTVAKEQLMETIRRMSFERVVFHLYNNVSDVGKLHVAHVHNGVECHEILAEIDGHGRWFDWKASL
ncbi:DUF2332 family protein [Alicyclobacillus sendaiensis]|uniref:DUF2332 family protein n=1 Tax=Alicyclobacillus sendaiensis TaxID=192387 RepID=UPI0034CD3C51